MALSAAYVCNQHFYEACGVVITQAAHATPVLLTTLVSYKTPVPRGLYLSEDAAHMSPVQGWPV